MIIAKLMGGLGNQMFQYAAGLRLARRHGTELKLDLSFYSGPAQGAPRAYELSQLRVRAGVASRLELAQALGTLGVLGSAVGYLTGQRPYSIVKEDGIPFQPALLDAPDFSYLDGYWQSERYFSDIRELLIADFTVTSPLAGLNRELAQQIARTPSISLHVRRQDYVTDAATHATHGTCGLDYYRAATALVQERVASPQFFVFSDDIEWARSNLSFVPSATFIGHNGPQRGCEDLRLMSACRHNITANSSFSWWAAWLNQHQEKIVIAPARWYARPELDTRDLVPAAWIRL